MRRALLAAGCAVMLSALSMLPACTSVVGGQARRVPVSDDADEAVIALLDTGDYPTTPNPAPGVAGVSGNIFEAVRMTDYVVGPWQVDIALRSRGELEDSLKTSFLLDRGVIKGAFNEVIADIVAAHGFVTGFTTFRRRDAWIQNGGKVLSLQNAVLRFETPDDAVAVVRAMEKPLSADGGERIAVPRHSDAVAAGIRDGALVSGNAFTAHGPFVMVQRIDARVREEEKPYIDIGLAVADAIDKQIKRLDEFTPTEQAKLADLPRDRSGFLMARTLTATDNRIPGFAGAGVYTADGRLHFEEAPVDEATLFKTTGVEWVSQLLTTVYQTHSRPDAAKVLDKFATMMAATDSVQQIDGVPGLPGAKCFERTKDVAPVTDPPSFQSWAWHFKCVAQTGEYVFTAFSADGTDARQQISAQYRILAGV